ncbi:endomucin isoform 3-T3 [Macrochelys suwanniensis]
MPVRQITSMKLLRAALLSLAVFSICTTNAQENSSMTPTSSNIQSTAAKEKSSMTPTSNNIQSTAGYTLQIRITTSKNIQSTPVSSGSTITTSSSTNVSGKTESLPESSVTAASDSTGMTTDLTTSITTSEHSEGHQTTSNADGSPPAPVTRTSAAVIKADTISPHWKSSLTPSHGNPGSKDKQADNGQYSSIILPVVIALIVITLSVFILVALYRMCRRTTPERHENGTEQAPTDKEGVKLLSVKTTSPETGEHYSQGKNRTHQPDESSSHLGNKYIL